jgi:hypothetical protein
MTVKVIEDIKVIYRAVFEHENQVIFKMTVFLTENPPCHIDAIFWYPNKIVVFGILEAIHFQHDAFFLRERVGVRLKLTFEAVAGIRGH